MNVQLIRQSFFLFIISASLGFIYTSFTKKGFFLENKSSAIVATDNFELIPLAKAKELLDSDSVIFLDTRHYSDYKNGHIKYAFNIPINELDNYTPVINSLPIEKFIIAYCDGADCNSSILMAKKLTELGFKNVKVFFGGWQEWKNAGYHIEK